MPCVKVFEIIWDRGEKRERIGKNGGHAAASSIR